MSISGLDNLNAVKVAENLALAVQYVHEGDVDGDVAEFGTCGGSTAVVLAAAMKHHGRHEWFPPKTLHLFDSFEGLPDPDSAVDQGSPHVQKGWWSKGGMKCLLGEAELKRRACEYLPAERVVTHAGWFKDTLQRLDASTRFSLLHIDCDLYQSAKDVLDYVFGNALVSPGAIVVFDDYNCNRADPKCGERRAWLESAVEFEIWDDDFGCRGWSSRSFVVHRYKGMPK